MSDRNPALDSIKHQLLDVNEAQEDLRDKQSRLISDLARTRTDAIELRNKRDSLSKAMELLMPPDCASNEPAPPPANPVLGGELTIDADAKAKLVLDLVGHPKTTLEFPSPPDGHPITAALRTLKGLGYTHEGAVEWKPPIGDPQARLSKALETFRAAINNDLGFAWSWHCNIAGPMADALATVGVTVGHREANYAAAALMRHLLGVDMERDGHYRDTQAPTIVERATPAAEVSGKSIMAEAAEAAKDLRSVGDGAGITFGATIDTDKPLTETTIDLVNSAAHARAAAPRQDVATWILKTTASPSTLEAWLPLTEHSGCSLHIARAEGRAPVLRARGVARLLENPVLVGTTTVFEANNAIWTATLELTGKNMQDQAATVEEDEAFDELDRKRRAAGMKAAFEAVSKDHAWAAPNSIDGKPIKVNLTYDWAQFVHYGLENTAGPVTHGVPWSFRFHGHPVTHENDSCYLVGGNSSSETLYFHKGDIITVDSDTQHISIASPPTPDALAPEVPEQAIALDMEAVAAAAVGKKSIHDQATDILLQVVRDQSKENRLIEPTIGRRVWYHPDPNSAQSGFVVHSHEQPLDAGVVYVWSNRMVNLDVTDHAGNHHAFTSVTLVQPGDPKPAIGAWCEWMPYQVKQAQGSK